MLDEEPTFRGTTPDAQTRLLIAGSGIFAEHVLPQKGELTVGRAADVDVVVEERSVSRRHAVFRMGAGLTVEDLGSANGTTLNDVPVPPRTATPVRAGDVVRVGDVAILVRGPRAGAAPVRVVGRDREPIVLAPAMREVYSLVAKLAPSSINVLILGETGVGKEVVARSIHARSPRASRLFCAFNAAALAENLIESELFGHEKGAFTGADRTKPGLLETASGGTVFLDEVGELPLSVQAKLLRVLEERQIRRLGSTEPRPIDVRILAATNRDLEAASAAGTFRSDLYFRLNGFSLKVPPLRDRREEIEPLVKDALEAFVAELGRKTVPPLSAAAREALKDHSWPGNVRELRNVIQRAVLLCGEGEILPEHLGLVAKARNPSEETSQDHPSVTQRLPQMSAPVEGEGLKAAKNRQVESVEKEKILAALESCAGNQTRAAEVLGISRRSLVMKLEKYGIPRPRKPKSEG